MVRLYMMMKTILYIEQLELLEIVGYLSLKFMYLKKAIQIFYHSTTNYRLVRIAVLMILKDICPKTIQVCQLQIQKSYFVV